MPKASNRRFLSRAQKLGAEIETLLAVEAGQWEYLQKAFFPSPYEEVEGEADAPKSDAPTDEKQAKVDEQQAEDDITNGSADGEAYELTELQQVLINAYRGQGQSIEWGLIEDYPDDLRLHIILSLSRRGLLNTSELLSKQPETSSAIDALSVDYRLLEMAVDSGDYPEALGQIERTPLAAGANPS